MPSKKKQPKTESARKMRPAITPEARERQMIALAMDRAEEQLLDGTASSQVITHFLKLATEKERLEREKLEGENRLLLAKTEALQSAQNMEAMYAEAIAAMKEYSGSHE